MEDDDGFGDLYTNVLRPFSSTSTTTSLSSSLSDVPQPHQPSPTPAHLYRPIDLNLQYQDDDNTLFATSGSVLATQTLSPFKSSLPPPTAVNHSIPNRDSAPEPMVLDSKQGPADGKEVKFDIEKGLSNGIGDMRSDDTIIPGLTYSARQEYSGKNNNGSDNGIRGCGSGGQVEAEGEGDDSDSDSEDDLPIVLNDDNHGPMAMERGGMMAEDDDDDDEDGDPLVIVADGDVNQGLEEQEWGEDGGQAADGERKEGGEAGKVGGGGGTMVASKIGYSNHGYHPFHSQFKVSVLI